MCLTSRVMYPDWRGGEDRRHRTLQSPPCTCGGCHCVPPLAIKQDPASLPMRLVAGSHAPMGVPRYGINCLAALPRTHCLRLMPIRGTGTKPLADISAIAVALHAISARLGVRVWVEYVESASNPADGLSRAGLEDAWTKAQGWTLKEVPCPKLFQMETASVDSIQSIVDAALP